MFTLLSKFKLFYFILLGLFPFIVSAQEEQSQRLEEEKNYYQYDSDFLPASFHQGRRDSLRSLLPDSTVAILFSAPERNRSNDVYYEYHQDPNFYYLTGLREPNSMVIIFKEEQQIEGNSTNEVLFVQNRDQSSELWNGRRLGKEGAIKTLGFDHIQTNSDFPNFNFDRPALKKVYFQTPYAFEDQDTGSTTTLKGLFTQFTKKADSIPIASEKHLNMMLAKLRQIKTSEEITLLTKAIEITCEAQNDLMRQIRPEMAEYQTEAIIEYTFKKNGAEYPGFPSIQGSGENSCILHYTSNRRPLKNGGLLVSDVGAEYRGYTADVTRTIPPSGKYSKEEKIIYNLVLKAQEAGIDSSKAGKSFWSAHLIAQRIIAKGLVKLKIIEKENEVDTYFMHGTSHYLGLDVHYAGLYTPLEVGNVITVEPGIYIAEGSNCDPKWWNIGVRIEDDILITKEGPVNLSASSPRTVEEIEEMMKK